MSRFVNPVPQFYLNNGDIASSGQLFFYETGTTTKKDTFSDFGRSTKNTNPVILDGSGRCPNIFGEGRYTVVFKSSVEAGSAQQWTRDDVEVSVEVGQYADWSPILTYRINDIVRGSNGEYYRSINNNNSGNDPTTTPSSWEEIAFLAFWNTNATYNENDVVNYNGELYQSIINSNSGNQPDQSSTNVWKNTSQPSAWISTIGYQEDEIVVHESTIWRSLQNNNTGNTPSSSSSAWASLTGFSVETPFGGERIVVFENGLKIVTLRRQHNFNSSDRVFYNTPGFADGHFAGDPWFVSVEYDDSIAATGGSTDISAGATLVVRWTVEDGNQGWHVALGTPSSGLRYIKLFAIGLAP